MTSPRLHAGPILVIAAAGAFIGLIGSYGLTGGLEGPLWLAVALVGAVAIGRGLPSRRFLHGFLAGLLAGAAAAIVHYALFPVYLEHQPEVAASLEGIPPGISPRVFFLLVGGPISLAYGLLLGALSAFAGRIAAARRNGAPPDAQ